LNYDHIVCLANIAIHYTLQSIARGLSEAELSADLSMKYFWINTSETLNELIRQALTFAVAKSGVELT